MDDQACLADHPPSRISVGVQWIGNIVAKSKIKEIGGKLKWAMAE